MIAEKIRDLGYVSIRQVLSNSIDEVQIENEVWEIVGSEIFLDILKDIRVDLTEQEELCLLSVLQKPQLGNHISVDELEEIMQSVNEELAEKAAYGSGLQPSGGAQDQSSSSPSPDRQKKKANKELDLSILDEESIMIMLELMMCTNDAQVTIEKFFERITYEQEVKSSNKKQKMKIMKSEHFFEMLRQNQIWQLPGEHENLKKFLELNPKFPGLLVLRNVKKAIQQLQENEEFMAAIMQQQNERDQYDHEQREL